MLEKHIQTQILNYFNYQPDCFIWRQNTGGVKSSYQYKDGPRKGQISNRFTKFGTRGQSDLMGIYKGRFLACEVKQLKGKLTEMQKKFLEKVYDAGGIAIVARSLEQLEEKLNIINNLLHYQTQNCEVKGILMID